MKYKFDSLGQETDLSTVCADVVSFFLDLEGCFYCFSTEGASFLRSIHLSEIFGIDDIKIMERYSFRDFLSEGQWQVLLAHIKKCSQTEEDVVTELLLGREGENQLRVKLQTMPSFQCRCFGREGYYSTMINISKYKQLHDAISWMEQINVVGKIASSVAHEVRNPLTVVRGHIQLLSWDESVKKHQEQLEVMLSEIDRAVEILTEFLHLSKPATFQLERQNINDILKNLWQLLNAEAIVNMHEMEYQLNDIPDVMLDKKRFRQVVLNLVKNGLQAMEREGKLIIKTYHDIEKVYFAVTDTGKGIPPHILTALGKPFFTTKENGTGLGLSACYNIITQHQAEMEVETGPNGTTFTIAFDALQANKSGHMDYNSI